MAERETTPAIHFRGATTSDASQIASIDLAIYDFEQDLARASMAGERKYGLMPMRPGREERVGELLRRSTVDETNFSFLMIEGDKIIGYMLLQDTDDPNVDEHILLIRGWGVLPEERTLQSTKAALSHLFEIERGHFNAIEGWAKASSVYMVFQRPAISKWIHKQGYDVFIPPIPLRMSTEGEMVGLVRIQKTDKVV